MQVVSTSPKNLALNIKRTGSISIKFSEGVKFTKYYRDILVKNLKTKKYVQISRNINGNILYIKTSSKRYVNTWYEVILPSKAVKDFSGNNLKQSYKFIFKTGRK